MKKRILTEIDGVYYEKCHAIIVPSSEPPNRLHQVIKLTKGETPRTKAFNLSLNYFPDAKNDSGVEWQVQNIYLLSGDKIRPGDWFYADEFAKIQQANFISQNLVNGYLIEGCRRVVVSDDYYLFGLNAKISINDLEVLINLSNAGRSLDNILVKLRELTDDEMLMHERDVEVDEDWFMPETGFDDEVLIKF